MRVLPHMRAQGARSLSAPASLLHVRWLILRSVRQTGTRASVDVPARETRSVLGVGWRSGYMCGVGPVAMNACTTCMTVDKSV